MKWKFWQKDDGPPLKGKSKQPGPKDLPERVGRYMVVSLGMDPDEVWSLKAVTRPCEDSSTRRDIRVFNPAAVDHAGITIRTYDTLDMHGEMILFEGWYDKKSDRVAIQIRRAEEATAA